MFARKMKSALLATAGAGALVALSMGSASATPLPFDINPNVLALLGGGTGGYTTPREVTDFQGATNSLVQQIGPTTQVETGYLQINQMVDGASILGSGFTGLSIPASQGGDVTNKYGLYVMFRAVVTGLTGTSGVGTIAPNGFQFALIADIGDNDTFTSGAATNSGGTSPTVTGTSGDIVLAVGASVTGSAGFQLSSGAPIISTISTFILCDGNGTEGKLGSTTIANASNSQGTCATGLNAATYFTAPSPFYQLDVASNTAGSTANIGTINPGGSGAPPNFLLTGVVADVNFQGSVPEPVSLSIFGAGLAGAAAFIRRRKAKKA